MRAGAITADLYSNPSGKVWFNTRNGFPARVYMFQPPKNLKYGTPTWTSWPLGSFGFGSTGGLRRIRSSWDSRLIFVRTPIAIIKVDTANNKVTTYCDTPVPDGNGGTLACGGSDSPVSDVAVDNRNNVYYTYNGYLQRVNAAGDSCATQPCTPVTVTRWDLNSSAVTVTGMTSSAGMCQGGLSSDPCLAGVAVNPKNQNLVSLKSGDFRLFFSHK